MPTAAEPETNADEDEGDHLGGPPQFDPSDPLDPKVPALAIEFDHETNEPPPGLAPTQFGGQPDWLEESLWPLSRTTGEQMEFIAQIALHPDDFSWLQEPKMAYLFVTNDEVDPGGIEHWDPFAGENAVIVQPGGRPGWLDFVSSPTGPTVGEFGRQPRLTPRLDPPITPDYPGSGMDRETSDKYVGLIDYDKVGGTPNFFQGVEMPLFTTRSKSMDPASGAIPILVIRDAPAAALNLGDAGRGVAFLSPDHRLGTYLWYN